MSMNSLVQKLWKQAVSVPTNIWSRTAVKISSISECDCIHSTLFVSTKCCHVQELIGKCLIWFCLKYYLVMFFNSIWLKVSEHFCFICKVLLSINPFYLLFWKIYCVLVLFFMICFNKYSNCFWKPLRILIFINFFIIFLESGNILRKCMPQ